MWWFLLFCGLLYGAFCLLWDTVVEYWWIVAILAAIALYAHKRKKNKKAQEERRNRALAEFEAIVPVDPMHTALGTPLRVDLGEEKKNAALDEMNLIMWAARAVSEYHAIDDLRNPVSDAAIKRNQRCVFSDKFAVVTAIERTCKLGVQKSLEIIPELVELNLLIPAKGGNAYTARLTANEYADFAEQHDKRLRIALGLESPEPVVVVPDMDALTGEEFEAYCADLLRENGFTDVLLTKHTGDHGVDITARKDGVVYAIQCKCYSSTVGNAAIQQIYSGKSLYNADVAVVMTNSRFTKQAIEDADRLRVRLWDREKLLEMQ